MSRIRGRGNKETEVALAKLLRKHGITGWRRQQRLRIEGKKRRAGPSRPTTGDATRPARRACPDSVSGSCPTNVGVDFLFPKARLAVFVDGCFWHGCPKHSNPAKWLRKSSMRANPPSSKGRLRRTGRAFWKKKLTANKARDRVVNRTLRREGWRVVRIWEHELTKNPQRCVSRIRTLFGHR